MFIRHFTKHFRKLGIHLRTKQQSGYVTKKPISNLHISLFMNRSIQLLLLLTLTSLTLTSCFDSKKDDFNYEWVDYGLVSGNVTGMAMSAFGNRIIVGSDNGLQYFDVGANAQWRNSNVTGVKITSILNHPLLPNVIIATADPNASSNTNTSAFPIYKSIDGGVNWSGITEGLVTEGSQKRPTVNYITWKLIDQSQIGARYADMYISLAGDAVARSKSDGNTWTVIKGDLNSNSTSNCYVNVMQSFYTYLYHGCENNDGSTYIDRIDLNFDDVTALPNGNRFVTQSSIGGKQVVGLRPSYYTPGLSYALLKGGVIAIVENEWRWVYQHPSNAGQGLNTIMTSFWINPVDLNNLVFGGYEANDNNTFSLYNSPDHGKSFTLIEPPTFLALTSPRIMASFEAGLGGRNMMLLVAGKDAQGNTRTRVISRNQVAN